MNRYNSLCFRCYFSLGGQFADPSSLWNYTYGIGQASTVKETSDGGYILTGYGYAGSTFLLKINANGTQEDESIYDYWQALAVSSTSPTDTDSSYRRVRIFSVASRILKLLRVEFLNILCL